MARHHFAGIAIAFVWRLRQNPATDGNFPFKEIALLKRLLVSVPVESLMLAGAAVASNAKSGGLDKAYLQAYWDGWASGNPEAQGKFFVQGPGHLFFDITPLN